MPQLTKQWRPFNDARRFAQSLALTSKQQWIQWSRTDARPSDIPALPDKIYVAEFIGYGDWLGANIPHKRMRSRVVACWSYEEARDYVRRLNFKNYEEYKTWAKSTQRPDQIPACPYTYYRANGWQSVGEWLGTNSRQRVFDKGEFPFRAFEKAREFARSLNLKNCTEWRGRTLQPDWPKDLPCDPGKRYRDKGWLGWGDFLGNNHMWNGNAVRAFLLSLLPRINELQPTELFTILQANGMLRLDGRNRQRSLIRQIEKLCCGADPEATMNRLVTLIGTADTTATDGAESRTEELTSLSSTPGGPSQTSPLASLHTVDKLASLSRDEAVLEFLINNRVAALWDAVLAEPTQLSIADLVAEQGETYFNRIRERFIAEYEGTRQIALPDGYAFHWNGQFTQPNLMQWRTAYRVKTERRVVNLSGPGSGKTLSAVLATRVVDARFTVVVAFNSTLEGWSQSITNIFPDSVVLTKEREVLTLDSSRHTYLVVNYEMFQQPWSEAWVRALTAHNQVDMVVLDEIQSVKQRETNDLTRRRGNILALMEQALAANPQLYVLGLSATPIINDLHEGKSLLDMILGPQFSHLTLGPTIENAISMHKEFKTHGIRHRPRYAQGIDIQRPQIDGVGLIGQLNTVRLGEVLSLEKTVMTAKLPTIQSLLRPGTLVYTHFVTGIVEQLQACADQAKLRVGAFTGDDKEGLSAFLNREIDVLIGSSPIGTGVDGLQHVSNRLIFACLPWTSAEFEQIIGRIHRQGSVFDKIEVIIPQVYLTHGEHTWSWDRRRMEIIEYKKTIADAVIDGIIPEGKVPTHNELQKESLKALKAWIARTASDDSVAATSASTTGAL